MTPWLLIIWIGTNHGVALVAHEFFTKAACDNAGKILSEKGEANPAYSIGFACVPKDLRDGVR